MPVANTGILGLQEDGGTGKISAYQGQLLQGIGFMSFVTDALIRLSGVSTAVRLFTAASSGLYLLTYTLEVITGAASALQTPAVQYTGYDQGGGQILTAQGSTYPMSATGNAFGGAIWFRAAASDIFVSTIGSGNPQARVGFSLFRAS